MSRRWQTKPLRTEQRDLFERPAWQRQNSATPLPPANRSRTSQAAARAIEAHAPTQCEQILEFVAGRGSHGATIEEIANGLGLLQSSVCGRVNDLRDAGRLRESGAERRTTRGRRATVWTIREVTDG